MMTITTMEREFHMEQQGAKPLVLNDPDSSMLPEDVLDLYALTYPILTTANMEGPFIENDKTIFKFRTTLGTKG